MISSTLLSAIFVSSTPVLSTSGGYTAAVGELGAGVFVLVVKDERDNMTGRYRGLCCLGISLSLPFISPISSTDKERERKKTTNGRISKEKHGNKNYGGEQENE